MSGTLRIGVNALYLIPGGVGGTEIYLRNLLAALAQIDSRNRYFVFTNQEAAAGEPLAPAASNFETIPCPVHAVNRPARLLWEQAILPRWVASRHLDVLFNPGFTSPVFAQCPNVTVIHDLQHKRQPQNFGWLELLAWRAAVWSSIRFSREIVTVSESSRKDILRTFSISGERVHVIGHGVEQELFHLAGDRSETGLGDWPYLLSVSTIHPHKNWKRWLEAYQSLVHEGFPHHLAISGLKGNFSGELDRQIRAMGLSDRVQVLGWVPRPALRALFHFADALVFPSTFEGFGMPVIEAMAAGIPVACSDIDPLREIGGNAALFFDPESVPSIADAVRRILTDGDLRSRMGADGRALARNYTWTRAAEQTLLVLRQAASGR